MKQALRRGMISSHDNSAIGAPTLDFIETEGQPQVLVVDDSKEIRDIVVCLLRISGYRAIAAENGFAAQLLLVTSHPTLIITDLNMPLCDGWELLAFCHANHPEIPVLIVSGESLGRHPEIEQWASAFVSKPFDSRRFRSEVERCMSLAARRP